MIEKIYKTNRGDIHYWTNEINGKMPTLAFLPGLTASHRLFDKQVQHFEDKYNVFVWDAPGHGASRPFTLNFSLKDKATYLHEILEFEEIEEPIMVGQSMGGYLAQCYMQNFPDSLTGFISIDSATLKRKYISGAELWLLKRTNLIYRPYPWKSLLKTGARGVAETEQGQKLMHDMMQEYTKDDYCDLVIHGYKILAEAIEENLAYDIDCPCLLLCGEKDKAGSTKRYNRKWSREEGLPIAWIKNAGHNSNTDEPKLISQIIEDFVIKHAQIL
ncbi:MAG: alpha/beta hydrolase [Clostridiales bacterium]|nr:alpha/beta hydrolase [Clostridiales bacterium]